jgi:hypothetical protein
MTLTAERLREILHYDPETGVFTNKVKRNRRTVIGTVAGSVYTKGYRGVIIQRVRYRENRLAWLYVYGVWPVGQVDHINHDRADNRIANLRDVSAFENTRNRQVSRTAPESGCPGVNRKPTGWLVTIKVNGRLIYLGLHKDLQTPISHRKMAEAKYRGLR